MQSLTRAGLRRLLCLKDIVSPNGSVVGEYIEGKVRIRHYQLGPGRIPALSIAPVRHEPGSCAVLYCHAHGGAYGIGKSELLEGRPALLNPPLARAIAEAGAVVFCADMPGFGERQPEGSESALAKSALWTGQTLLGQMVSDQLLALAVLIEHEKPSRVATLGISMGGTLAYLVAALREDIAAVAHLCVFADIAPLIETGDHDLHGPYLTIPGLLPAYDMSDIAALVTPRYQLVATGGGDPLTPDSAYECAMARLTEAYGDHPERLTIIRDKNSGHCETELMREAVLAFLAARFEMTP
ncbi:MAG: alpha/beta fold hydrolase [Parvularculales bacterium]